MRTFMAIRTNTRVETQITKTQEFLKINGFFGSWPKRENAHLTLFFFGDIDDQEISVVEDLMDRIIPPFKPFPMRVSGIGLFPSKGLPRVVWLKCEGSEVLNLYEKLNVELKKHGFAFQERFTPHLTVGRLKGIPKNCGEVISNITYEPVSFECNTVELFSSTLTHNGSVYSSVHKSIFGG